jgi:hypothetical protein
MLLSVDSGVDSDGVERARAAWWSALCAHARAAKTLEALAEMQAQVGLPDLAEVALERAADERAKYDAALAAHPGWAANAPA